MRSVVANYSVVQVFRKHEGEYECSASNGDGPKEATARINIRVRQSKFTSILRFSYKVNLYIFFLNYKRLCVRVCVCVSVMSCHFKISLSHLNTPSHCSDTELNI